MESASSRPPAVLSDVRRELVAPEHAPAGEWMLVFPLSGG
jgi:hypothetical protein